ncbi:hypothetical protein BHE74_00051800, partial [Ensete ventricosum]
RNSGERLSWLLLQCLKPFRLHQRTPSRSGKHAKVSSLSYDTCKDFNRKYDFTVRAVYLWIFDPVEREAIIANIAVKKNIDYQAIIEIACVNSPKELLVVKEEYHARYKRSLEEDIAVHTNAVGKAGSTDEDALTRVIVMRAEKDLKVIKEMFHKRTNATLKRAVGTETSGHYNSFLLALVGN